MKPSIRYATVFIVSLTFFTHTCLHSQPEHALLTKSQPSDTTITVLHGIAESCTHLTDVVIEKDKKKKKRGFFRLLCSIFNTVVTIIGNHKSAKRSIDSNFEDYNQNITNITGDFLELIKDNTLRTPAGFMQEPSHLYQLSCLENRANQEQAIMRLLQTETCDQFITELCDELMRFLNTALVSEILPEILDQ